MEVLTAIRQRRAVRHYKPDAVPAGLLRRIIVAASWAPSAMNEQLWRFTVVTGRPLLDEISAQSKVWMLGGLAALPRPDHFHDLLSDPTFDIFYRAPALVVISAPAARPWAIEDCALAAQNLMLAATALELGSCWIGFAQGWLNTQEGRQALKLPAQEQAVAPIVIGYPKTVLPPAPRKPLIIAWIGENALRQQEAGVEPGLHA
jgi:nitroreductase